MSKQSNESTFGVQRSDQLTAVIFWYNEPDDDYSEHQKFECDDQWL